MTRFVLILGMHRSGTSCTTRMLDLCGLHLGNRLLDQPSHSNMDGKWESREVLEINDEILAASEGRWDLVPQSLTVPEGMPERMDQFLQSLSDHEVAGWKEPRTVVTFPAWKEHLSDYRIVACVRHPLAVAKSLSLREGWSLEKGLSLWVDYNKLLLAHTAGEKDVVWFDFDQPAATIGNWLQGACEQLGLQYCPEALNVFNELHRHHQLNEPPEHPEACHVYGELLARVQKYTASSMQSAEPNSDPNRTSAFSTEPLSQLVSRLSEVYRASNALAQRQDLSLRHVHTEIGRLRGETGSLRTEVSGIKAELAASDQHVESRTLSLQQGLERVSAMLENQRQSLKGLYKQLRSLDEKVSSTPSEITSLQEQIAALAQESRGQSSSHATALCELDQRLEDVIASMIQQQRVVQEHDCLVHDVREMLRESLPQLGSLMRGIQELRIDQRHMSKGVSRIRDQLNSSVWQRFRAWCGGWLQRGEIAKGPRVCFLGDGISGSWQMRAKQIAALNPAWKAIATKDLNAGIIANHDLFCIVKRIQKDVVDRLKTAGKIVVYDTVDPWKQPDDGLSLASVDEIVGYFQRFLHDLALDGVIFANQTMREDLEHLVRNPITIYHHHRVGLLPQPVRNRAEVVGYEGEAAYLGPWQEIAERVCGRLGLRFAINPSSLGHLDIGLAVRGGPHGSLISKRYKSNVKLANFYAAGLPCVVHADEVSYQETNQGDVRFFRSEEELENAIRALLPYEQRKTISERFVEYSANFRVERMAKLYASYFQGLEESMRHNTLRVKAA